MPFFKPPRFRRFKLLTRRWRYLFGRSATWTVVLVVGLVLFNWPFIDSTQTWQGQELFHFYFISWGFFIVLLCFIGLCSSNFSGKKDDEVDH